MTGQEGDISRGGIFRAGSNGGEGLAAQTLRVGIVCGPVVFEAWQVEALRRMASVDGVTIAALIRLSDPAGAGSTMGDEPASKAWVGYRALAERIHQRWAQEPVEIPELLRGATEFYCQIEKTDGGSLWFCESDLSSIRQVDLDAMLYFGCEHLRGEIHNLAQHGIWSFDHLPDAAYPGCPVGFWDVYHDRRWTEVTLRRIAKRRSDEAVLYKRAFRTNRYSCTMNAQHAIWRAVDWPAAVCRRLLFVGDGGAKKEAALPNAPQSAPPNSLKTCIHVARTTKRLAAKQYRDVFLAARGSRDRWALGVVDRPIDALMNPATQPSSRWIEAPSGGFLADPFVAQIKGKTFIFCEHWVDETRKGHIAVIESSDLKTFDDPYPVIEAPFHLSYPFVIQESGDWYCVPEQHENGAIGMYRAFKFPGVWEKCGVLVAGFPGVDPTLIQIQGRWWMFAARAGDEMGAAEGSLHAFYSDSIHGPWEPHSLNPVVQRRGCSRPAGRLFWSGSRLVRPVQECLEAYGEAILFYEITNLSRSEYSERLIGRWERSDEWPYPSGMHHIERLDNGSVLVDAKRYPDVRPAPGVAVAEKVGSLGRRIQNRLGR